MPFPVYTFTRDNIDEAELNNTQSAERLADGQLDAYFYAAGTPVAAMIQLDNTKGMDLYSFSDEEVATVTESGLVIGNDRGEAAVIVRYLEFIESSFIRLTRRLCGHIQ